MDMIGRIRRLHSQGKKSLREIARMTGLSRNTVAKWLHGEVDGPPKYRRQVQPNELTPFVEASTRLRPARADRGTSGARPRRCMRRSRQRAMQVATRGWPTSFARVARGKVRVQR